MVGRESLTANVAPGGAEIYYAEYMDPLEYKKLQCCKNLFTRYGFIDRKTKITEDAA